MTSQRQWIRRPVRLLTISIRPRGMLMRHEVKLHLARRVRTNVNPLAGRNIQWKMVSREGVCVADPDSAL